MNPGITLILNYATSIGIQNNPSYLALQVSLIIVQSVKLNSSLISTG